MERSIFITELIKDAIANDYEHFEMIMTEVSAWAAESGIFVSREEVAVLLLQLVRSGMAASYALSPHSVDAEPCAPQIADPSCYFLLTQAGKRLLMPENDV